MTEVPATIYTDNFMSVFNWFTQKVHRFDPRNYIIIDLPGTHLKLVEILNAAKTVIFRVILKATFEPIQSPSNPDFDIRSITYLQKTKSAYPVSSLAALNICYIQLNPFSCKPVNEVLYIFSNNRLFELEKEMQMT